MEMQESGRTVVDVLIVGGGPIGLACAIAAKKKGLKCLVIEKGTIVNSIFNYPVNMSFFSTSERLEIGEVPFVSGNAKPTRAEALEYYRRIAHHHQLAVSLFEKVETIADAADGYNVSTTKSSYKTTFVIIATGFYDIPYLLNTPGEHLSKVKHYYDDPHLYAFQKVVVVGASNSAVDAALETWRKGAAVTMVVRGPAIGERVKYWVKPDIENRIKEGSITAHFNAAITAITPKTVTIQTAAGIVEIENDWVLAMTGYQPDLQFLQHIGIQLSDDAVRKPYYDEETMETNKPNIFLAGVICGGMNTHRLFIENSRVHAEKIMEVIGKRMHPQTTGK